MTAPLPETQSAPWQNRIVGYGEEAPDQLLANPKNAAIIHPLRQQQAMGGVLREVGIVAPVIVNQRTGFVVDGHMRVAMAISAGQPTLPIAYVELTDAQESLVIATFDTLTGMRVYDAEHLELLLRDISTQDADVDHLLEDLARSQHLTFSTNGVDTGFLADARDAGDGRSPWPAHEATTEAERSDTHVFTLTVTPQQRDVIMATVTRAKDAHGFAGTAEALVAICEAYRG